MLVEDIYLPSPCLRAR